MASPTTLTNQNLNLVIESGNYIGEKGNSVVNKPSGVDDFSLTIYKTSSGYIAQDLTTLGTDGGEKKWVRLYNFRTWTEWAYEFDTSSLSNADTLDGKHANDFATADQGRKADTALQFFTETDPTVPSWAKQPNKPTYTAREVGAEPADNSIVKDSSYVHTDNNFTTELKTKLNGISVPTKVSQLTNDTGFITNTVSNLTNYYTTTNTYSKTEINALISNIHTLDILVVTSLPSTNISTTTIYLVAKTGTTNDIYDEYIYVNNAWEMIGNTVINLSNYLQKNGDGSNLISIFTQATTDTNISSGEKLSVSLGKIAKAISNLISHLADNVKHVTAAERTTWNAKSTLALGETSFTAYRGDRGKTAYDHSQVAHAPSNAQKNSDITKTEIEAKLVGEISSHSHAVKTNATNDTVTFTQDTTRNNILTNETMSVLFGKISKWFADLKTVAFSGSYNDLSNKPTIPTNGSFSLSGLSDINIITPSDGQIISWDATLSKWKNINFSNSEFKEGVGYSTIIGNGSTKIFTITHNLSTKNISITLWNITTGENLWCEAKILDVDNISLTFDNAPTNNNIRVVIHCNTEFVEQIQTDWNATSGKAALLNKPSSLPASDVYSWAKASTKPSYSKSEVGLGNVDNTSDVNKPISTAQQTALNSKEDLIKNAVTKTSIVDADTIPISDSAATSTTKKITFSVLKAGLKTYFDTLYNKYSLPTATSTVLGGVKSGTDITVDASGNVSVNDNSHNHTIANVSGLQTALDGKLGSSANAVSASKLLTARTINGVSFDGTVNITIADSTKEPLFTKNTAFNKNFEATASNIKANGTQSVGSLSTIARADHVHPMQTSVSGNAGTATKLANARTINGVSFDGTSNITTPIANSSDVTLTTLQSGQILQYNGTKWVNSDISSVQGVKKYSTSIGNGSSTSFTITHNLNTEDIIVNMYQGSIPNKINIWYEIKIINANSFTIDFGAEKPSTNLIRVVVLG